MEQKRCVLIVCDGVGDRPMARLGGKTPLEATDTPSLDEIAKSGICGLMDTISPGVPPGSDVANLALLGYDPYKFYTGRGAFEALGCGFKLKPGDVAFRTNFSTADENLVILDRRAGRRVAHADRLAKAISKVEIKEYPDVEVLFKNSIEHRGALLLRGRGLSRMVSDSDPHKNGRKVLEVVPLDKSAEAKKTASIVNAFTKLSYQILKDHPANVERARSKLPPANIIILRGAGSMPKMDGLDRIYGVKPAAIVASALVRGVCIAAGMKIVNVPGATGGVGTDAMAKGTYAVKSLKDFDFLYVHVKGTDAASHDGSVEQKINMIKKVDGMVGYILDHVDRDSTYIALTADHTTAISARNHTGDPVPLAITGPGVRVDAVSCFSERSCSKGGMIRIRGQNLVPILMNYLEKGKKFGA